MINHRDLFQAVGGRPVVEKVHKLLYDALFAHPWLGKFFEDVDQDFLESQQTDFMSSISGGPKSYVGQSPQRTHIHMYLTEEIVEIRHGMLDVALREVGVSEEGRVAWLKLDRSFFGAVVKRSIRDCKQRYSFEGIQSFENPEKRHGAIDVDSVTSLLPKPAPVRSPLMERREVRD